MNHAQRAVGWFNEGYNCAQAVLAAFGEESGIDEETALKVACGFGGGCGRLGLTCGAVSGAFMVIGMKYGKVRADDNQAKEKCYAKIREFTHRFRHKNRSINCVDLLGVDIGTPGGREEAEKQGLLKTVCPTMVGDAAEILDEIA